MFSRRSLLSALAICGFVSIASPAFARPSGFYGQGCVYCHTGGFLVGRSTPDAVLEVFSNQQSTIPPAQFGDPDRGEGPLPTYSAAPGGTFQLTLNVKDTTLYAEPFTPDRWALGMKHIYTTDPNYQNGDTDKNTWRNDQLTLVGAYNQGDESGNPFPIPADQTGWTLQTDTSFMEGSGVPIIDEHINEQYYTSADSNGHEWIGPTTLQLTVTVPAGVLPGWYDIEMSGEGLDTDFNAFYDEQHFYLHVAVPTNPGDVNCDGLRDGRDIQAFVRALLDPAGFPAAYPGCNIMNADVNQDSSINTADAPALATMLLTP